MKIKELIGLGQDFDDLMKEYRVLSFNEWNFIISKLAINGYSLEEMITYLENNMRCSSYSRGKTVQFIKDYARTFEHITIKGIDKYIEVSNLRRSLLPREPTFNVVRSGTLFNTGLEVIEYFFKESQPVLPMFDIPEDVEQAAHYYYQKGFLPFPKRKGEKHPMVRYAHLRNVGYPESNISDRLIWDGGICLLGDDKHCYLDLDNHEGGDNGVKLLDRKLLAGRHYEKTMHGYHIFGLGKLISVSPIQGVEIKGFSNLIVAYPSEGYKVFP